MKIYPALNTVSKEEQMGDMQRDDELVTVCSACLTASCWNYEFCCEEYRTAGTVEKTVRELIELDREHPDHWKAKA